MKKIDQPVWQVGFRPLFTLAIAIGLSYPILWALIFTGTLPLFSKILSGPQWHSHEMFFGFGGAILGGFLLTSTKNWVHIRGYHGRVLMILTGAWIIERIGMSFGDTLPPPVFFFVNNFYLVMLTLMIQWTLIRHRETDTFKDNFLFLIILPMLIISKNLLLHASFFNLGTSMAIGAFRVAFLIMLERTVTQFMKGAFQVQILRNFILDSAIKSLALVLIMKEIYPLKVSLGLEICLAALLLGRLLFWKPLLAFRRIDLSIMYIGYICILSQLVLDFISSTYLITWTGSVSTHLFTVGAMGSIIPAMIMRISKGHTGRKVVFDRLDKLVLWGMLGGFFVRIIFTQVDPAHYTLWILCTGICWFVSFLIMAIRYIPFLLGPRIDGREH